MSQFKVGDTVWFFSLKRSDCEWKYTELLMFPSYISLKSGKIIDDFMVDEKRKLRIYIGESLNLEIEYIEGFTEIYSSKENALEMLQEEVESLVENNAN